MIAPVSSTSSVYPTAPVRGQPPIHPSQRFAIPESPLRHSNGLRSTDATDSVLADTVALSGMPALQSMQQPYSAPPALALGPGNSQENRTGLIGDEEDETIGQGTVAAGQSDDPEETEETDESEENESVNALDLDEQEQKEVDELQTTDREVRQHEQAHKSVGGSLAGAISYDYQRGPDGKNYAVGGEVSIDVSAEADPSATIAKMRRVRSAALAPAQPSGQDRQVAAQASKTEMEARQELSAQNREENSGESEKTGVTEEESETGTVANSSGTAPSTSSSRINPVRPTGATSANPIARLSAPYNGDDEARQYNRSLIDVFA